MKIAALTGAGVSKASGVPTFIEMGELRNKLSREYYNTYPSDFFNILMQMKEVTDKAEPNDAHLALAQYKIPIVTMNIDGLHQKAGTRKEDIIEIHGSLRNVFCSHCGQGYDFSVIKSSIYCSACEDSILQPDIVLYGDIIPQLYKAIERVAKVDLLLVVGTSFYTSTATYISEAAKAAGVQLKIINENAETIVPQLLKKQLD